MVAVSDGSVQYITNDGDLFGAGSTKNNELFNDVTEDQMYTTFTKTNTDIKHLYLGTNIRYYVKNNGDLYVVGNNVNGEYGDGLAEPNTPETGTQPVLVAQDVETVGFCHYYDVNGHLFLCGDNTYGQISSAVAQQQTYSLRRQAVAELPETHVPWTDVTKTEIGWTDEDANIVNLAQYNVQVEGEPEEGDQIALTFNTRRLIPVGLDVAHGDRVGFRFVTAQEYEQLVKDELVTGNLIYAITDGKTLLMGNKPYSINNQFVESYPEHPAQGVLYFNTLTKGVKMYNGAEWTSIVPDIRNAITDAELEEDLLTAKAIRDYIDPMLNEHLIKDVTFNNIDNVFTVIHIDGQTNELPLRNIVCGVSYENDTFTFNRVGADANVLNIPAENYLVDAQFDGRTLTMILKDGVKIIVDLFDLLTIFTGQETESATVTVQNQEMSIDVKLSQSQGNAIINVDGLFVPDSYIKSVKSNNLMTTQVIDGQLTNQLKISQAQDNSLTVKEDGLFTNRVPIELYYDKLQMDDLTNAEKDKIEFDEEIILKAEPGYTHERHEVYNVEEVKTVKGWLKMGQ
jgi:hypothetical protein